MSTNAHVTVASSAIDRLTHELCEGFDTALQGTNLKESDLKTLTGGARIANVFRERFPFELVKVGERMVTHRRHTFTVILRSNFKIKTCAIKRSSPSRTSMAHGKTLVVFDSTMCTLSIARPGLFTPDKAFEYIVQMQVAKFEDPIMKCVDMVVSELLLIIHEATCKVSSSAVRRVVRCDVFPCRR
jgi:dynamin 1/3